MSSIEQEKREYFRRLYTEDPAKHYVRVHGWLNAAKSRFHKIQSEARRKHDFAQYFTFPGEHAIDVFLMAENGIIEENKVGFPGVVYCERHYETVSLINKKLGRCRAVFSDSFERAVFRNEFHSCCPFDIINLDLTKEVFPLNGRPESNTIRAIDHLLGLHKNSAFDLYITFKSSVMETNPDAVEEFTQMVNDNFEVDKTLKEEFVKHCGMEVGALQKSDFTLFWCKSFPKWVLETGLANNVAGSIEGEYVYQRKPRYEEPYHIVTFLFAFGRKNPGLMSKHRMVIETQAQIRKSFSLSPTDVDKYLRMNSAEKESLRRDAKRIAQKPSKVAEA